MPQVPAHFYTEKNGRMWHMVCLHCGEFIGAAPDQKTLACAAQTHNCERKKKPVSAKPLRQSGQHRV